MPCRHLYHIAHCAARCAPCSPMSDTQPLHQAECRVVHKRHAADACPKCSQRLPRWLPRPDAQQRKRGSMQTCLPCCGCQPCPPQPDPAHHQPCNSKERTTGTEGSLHHETQASHWAAEQQARIRVKPRQAMHASTQNESAAPWPHAACMHACMHASASYSEPAIPKESTCRSAPALAYCVDEPESKQARRD